MAWSKFAPSQFFIRAHGGQVRFPPWNRILTSPSWTLPDRYCRNYLDHPLTKRVDPSWRNIRAASFPFSHLTVSGTLNGCRPTASWHLLLGSPFNILSHDKVARFCAQGSPSSCREGEEANLRLNHENVIHSKWQGVAARGRNCHSSSFKVPG